MPRSDPQSFTHGRGRRVDSRHHRIGELGGPYPVGFLSTSRLALLRLERTALEIQASGCGRA